MIKVRLIGFWHSILSGESGEGLWLVQLPFTSAHCILNNAGTSTLIVELEPVAKMDIFRYKIDNFMKAVFYKMGDSSRMPAFEGLCAWYYFSKSAAL